MPYRRFSPQFKAGELTPQDAAALNQMADDLYRFVGGFSVAAPLVMQDDIGGTRIGLGTAIGSGVGGNDQDTRYCTILLSAVAAGDITITVQSAALFPAPSSQPNNQLLIRIDNEIFAVTNGPPNGTTWQVLRAQMGTVADSHPNYTPVCQLFPAIQTTLQANVGTTDTIFQVGDVANFPPFGRFYFQIDQEQCLLTDGAGTSTWTGLRGQNGTNAAKHNAGATIYQVLPDSVLQAATLIFDDDDFLQPGQQSGQTTAVHHEVLQIIRLVGTNLTGNGYYDAVLEIWDSVNRTMLDSYPVWAKDLNS